MLSGSLLLGQLACILSAIARDRPAIDRNFHVRPRKRDAIDSFLFVHFTFQPGDVVDLRRIKHSCNDVDRRAAERESEKQSFH